MEEVFGWINQVSGALETNQKIPFELYPNSIQINQKSC